MAVVTAVLALDMATKTGWALRDAQGLLTSGVVDLSLRRGESTGMRLLRFRRWLREVLAVDDDAHQVELVAYEATIVHARRPGSAAVAHNLEGVLLAELEALELDYTCATPSAIKKHATGKGNAGKPAMIAAARKRWGVEPSDDNEADALCVLAWALEEVGEV